MKLHSIRRGGVAVIAVAALSTGLAACGSSSNNASDTTGNTGTTDNSSTGATPAPSSTTSSSTSDISSQVFGPACSSLPTGSTDGSLDSMVVDPVATAASTNPLLTTLTATVTAANLGDTLNQASALTVFAPADSAFAALPKATVTSLLAGAKRDGANSALAQILKHHVLAANDDPAAVRGTQTTLDGDKLTIKGTPAKGMTVSDGTVTAKVLCGNIPTKNATVYVIDKVLTGAKVTS